VSGLRQAVERAVRTFGKHPECLECSIEAIDDNGASVALTLNVEMPLAWRAIGRSPNGVKCQETVNVKFGKDYPWSAPRFYLREDFDRSLPHIQPGSRHKPPEPCLIDGSLDEYFFEVGLLALVEQLREWLCRAAKGALINASQGWEPILRNSLFADLVADPGFLRSLVKRGGGVAVLRTDFFRIGPTGSTLGSDAHVIAHILKEQVALNLSVRPPLFATDWTDHKCLRGTSIAIVVWPGKQANGSPIVADQYFPETIESMKDLRQRARELECLASLDDTLTRLDTICGKGVFDDPLPIAVFLCVRRPYPLINSDSTIELLPYVFDLALTKNRSPLLKQPNLPVIPATQLDSISPALLQAASGAEPIAPVVVLGCGSVGSKLALHLARSGTLISSVVDNAWLRPHNLARHGLAQHAHAGKANALSKALKTLGQETNPIQENVLSILSDDTKRHRLLKPNPGFVIDTTASLRVRSRISGLVRTPGDPRYMSVALFGEGRGAYAMIEGKGGLPSIDDITSAYYARIASNTALREAATATDGELRHVATGQGCGTLTMRMTDTRVSLLAAGATEQCLKVIQSDSPLGYLAVGVCGEDARRTEWVIDEVHAPVVVNIPGHDGWKFHLAPEVLEKIRGEIANYATVETGGTLLGRANERLKSITVVDVIEAPPDSKRSAGGFVLGTTGAKASIDAYHENSGRTLYDVGTWHSHLSDQPPSPRDLATAKELAGERPPPFALLIVTPNELFGVMYDA